MEHKQIVVVLGMHRSGTSAITRGLQVLGVDLGGNLLSAEQGNNEKGFFEDAAVTDFNVELLKALGHDWHTLTPILPEELESSVAQEQKVRAIELLRSKLAGIECFGVKDPRMARLLPFWQSVFAALELKVSYVVAFRNPKSVAHSLVKRNGFELEKGYFLWLEHMLFSLKHSKGTSRVFVNYDLMLQEPEKQLQRMSASLGLPFDPQGPEFVEYQHKFLERGLQHNIFTPQELSKDPAVPVDVLKLSNLLLELSQDTRADDKTLDAVLDELHRNMLERLPAYRLMRHFEDQSAEMSLRLAEQAALSEQHVQTIKAGVVDLESRHSALESAHGDLASRHDELFAQYRHLQTLHSTLASEYVNLESRERALENQVEAVKGVLADSERSIQSLQSDLQRHASGRFLLKSLVLHMAERFGLRYRGDNPAESELFDANYYLTTYDDVRAAGVDPLWHYLEHGWREGRDPSAGFSSNAYLEHYADVRLRRINPLIHYLRHGYYEGRPIFDTKGRIYHLSRKLGRHRTVVQLLNLVSQQPQLLGRFVREARRGGLRHAIAIAARAVKRHQKRLAVSKVPEPLNEIALTEYEVLKVVPYYLDPYLQEVSTPASAMVAVHLHLHEGAVSSTWSDYLKQIPVEFDLFISLAGTAKIDDRLLRDAVPMLRKLEVETVPAASAHFAPLIIQFGSRLVGYDYVAHFHDMAGQHTGTVDRMDLLCGSPASVGQIFDLLGNDAKVVFPVELQPEEALSVEAGWSDARGVLSTALAKHLGVDDVPFASAEFPHVGMFWARLSAISDFIGLDLQYEDFAAPEADCLTRSLERLLLICSAAQEGRNYQLQSPQLSREPLAYYEPQSDYSASIVHDTIKVLAYYLPQFHPTPENDEWHGEGFTEWYKVRSANPLFYGHYQQHVPHQDIGYYHLDGTAQLMRQAEMMKKSGVHGLIFYHYWFTGRMILEKPAQMLLANPQIDMPFCFCWANENWTRRWDGNEQEVLLGQVYSEDDARDFIRYLIPFFKDERYIKVDGRPKLSVYRPSSIEHCERYIAIWREECEKAGVKAPYVVATLTRGATDPQHYGMDAAIERVLHDWTGDAVADTRSQLRPYWPLEGSVLNYTEVADHYMEQDLGKDFTLFRSLVPTWDNTARYGTRAYVLDNFTTSKFQSWVERLIDYSEQYLPEDRRFVVINAWNEWAEGAHLEPDTRFGYGYLNSIGRAMSGQPFTAIDHVAISDLKLDIVFNAEAMLRLEAEPATQNKFLKCLASSGVFQQCSVTIQSDQVFKALQGQGVKVTPHVADAADFTLEFSDICLFPADSIELMLKMAIRHKGFAVSANLRNDPDFVQGETTVNFMIEADQVASMVLRPNVEVSGYKICCDATCLRLMPEVAGTSATLDSVTTIMRYHRRGERASLINALLSLIAQSGCQVKPVLAIQDMNDDEMAVLEKELARLPWDNDFKPVIRRYFSTEQKPDLRSLMLNDALKAVGHGYAAFLDYDDMLFPTAYAALLEQIKSSGKNATFARVYSTMVDATTGCTIKREKIYDYGETYRDFVEHNHAPLHSFLLDLDKCDLEAVTYFDDMKYMEDYYLTMQLFTRTGTDWASLRTCGFIGDYIHRVGCDAHTLALTDEQQRTDLLGSESYQVCEARIKAMRDRLLAHA
ncbi:glycoside hydrolase family 99-like domain-containing protein [Pseudomonas sp. SWRI111]|uniref:glycoside hydrolase family 99-like domain-containing protein n=1 Tax=Pseudomonas sp. SWRI111 TaxID=2745507 RepID=UPI001647C756|nr:glycoside hydrolase family 99-like domain-containing protein [Pseudomonas sp. SWRI111]MBC3207679.1 glycoside hydrolase family 99-like domain-containing protein [Pseudomonas sp. SWRI111]